MGVFLGLILGVNTVWEYSTPVGMVPGGETVESLGYSDDVSGR